MHREVLAARRRVLGDEHLHTLSSMDNLAIALRAAGQHGEAAAMHREVLAARRRVLGDEHPDTLSSMGNLAIALNAAGQHDEAAAAPVHAVLISLDAGCQAPDDNGNSKAISDAHRWLVNSCLSKARLDARVFADQDGSMSLSPSQSSLFSSPFPLSFEGWTCTPVLLLQI